MWFRDAFGAPTEPQARAWPQVKAGRDVLIAAPTGSGKTLSAFLAAIDSLVRQGLEGALPDETQVVYVSPLKALSNDIQRNLEAPLAGIRARVKGAGACLTSTSGPGCAPATRRLLSAAKCAVARPISSSPPQNRFTSCSAPNPGARCCRRRAASSSTRSTPWRRTSAARISRYRSSGCRTSAGGRLQRIGLSATQKPIESVARFLVGAGEASQCEIIDAGHVRQRDLALEVPNSPLEAVMSTEVWSEVYDRIAALAREHRTTLVFVNTRRMAERVARQLSERLGETSVAAHHGSMAKELRLDAEQRLKRGDLKVLVATASLELGIDIGDVELVCQLGSPRSISSFLQRVGRSGHAVAGTPKGRLFPLSRDDLVECAALLDSARRGELDALAIPRSAAGRAGAANCRRSRRRGLQRRGVARDAFARLALPKHSPARTSMPS